MAQHFGNTALLVCDESGSTGINYLDPQQRVFVFAGWLIPEDLNSVMTIAQAELLTNEFEKTRRR